MKIQNGFSLKPLTPEEKATRTDSQLREAAKMYETHFLNEMVKAMRSTVHNEEGLIKAGFAEKLFTEQLDQQYVNGWAERGGVGLADVIYTQIRERYLGSAKKDFLHSGGVMPLKPESKDAQPQVKMIPPQAQNQMEYRFEMQGRTADVQAPLAGRVLELNALNENWSSVKLDHGRGLFSEMTFPGQVAQIGVGGTVEPGQKLGQLDPARPVLAWKLEWT